MHPTNATTTHCCLLKALQLLWARMKVGSVAYFNHQRSAKVDSPSSNALYVAASRCNVKPKLNKPLIRRSRALLSAMDGSLQGAGFQLKNRLHWSRFGLRKTLQLGCLRPGTAVFLAQERIAVSCVRAKQSLHFTALNLEHQGNRPRIISQPMLMAGNYTRPPVQKTRTWWLLATQLKARSPTKAQRLVLLHQLVVTNRRRSSSRCRRRIRFAA